jgi:TrmH family RNA methyltransferase
MIESTKNPKVKRIRRLLSDRRFRHREGAYVVEGTRWLAELDASGLRPQLVLATRSWLEAEGNMALAAILPEPVVESSQGVMAWASDAETPPGVLAVVPMTPRPLPEEPTLLLIVDGMKNPGNLGALLRTAAAAGADAVLLAPGCVDVYNPKVIRGGMGAHLRLPIAALSWPDIEALTAPLVTWLAVAAGETRYDNVDWRRPSALIVGGEASGAGREANALATGRLRIPMHNETESLNAAAAAAIILFEAARQRLG